MYLHETIEVWLIECVFVDVDIRFIEMDTVLVNRRIKMLICSNLIYITDLCCGMYYCMRYSSTPEIYLNRCKWTWWIAYIYSLKCRLTGLYWHQANTIKLLLKVVIFGVIGAWKINTGWAYLTGIIRSSYFVKSRYNTILNTIAICNYTLPFLNQWSL